MSETKTVRGTRCTKFDPEKAAIRHDPANEPAQADDVASDCSRRDVESVVCLDIKRRQQIGLQKYGQSVAECEDPLVEWLRQAYEECLDQAIYLKRAIAEIEPTELIPAVLAKAGNVIQKPNGGKYVARKDHETDPGCVIVCEEPHGDEDFSYLCGSNWCRCTQ